MKGISSQLIRFTVFICLGVSLFLGAQNRFRHYSASDGLAHDLTYNITQDSKGYIWIGTDDGLSRFDGRQFKTYDLKNGLTSNYVMDIEELNNYKFAISTWGRGLHFLDNDTIVKSSKFRDQNSKIYTLGFHKDRVYAASGSTYFFYDLKDSSFAKKGFKKHEGFKPHDVKVFDFNLVGITTINGVDYLHDQESFKEDFHGIRILEPTHDLTEVFPFLEPYPIGAIMMNKSGEFVFARHQTLIFASKNRIKMELTINAIPNHMRITKILQAPNTAEDYVLLAQDKDGFKRIYTYNLSTGLTQDLIAELSISTTVSDAIFDFEGNLWVTTFGDGVYCYYYSNPEIIERLEGTYVLDLVSFKGDIYALTSSRLYKFKDMNVEISYSLEGFAKQMTVVNNELIIAALRLEKDRHYAGYSIINGRFYSNSSFGIIRQADTIYVQDHVIYEDNEIIISAFKDDGKELELFTNKGKWNYNFETQNFYSDSSFSLSNGTDHINGYFNFSGIEYFLTDKGLILKTGESQVCFDESKGLENERINDLQLDDDIYLATQTGLSVLKGDAILNFSKSFGLNSLAVNSILVDKEYLWLAGENGISIIKKSNLGKTASPRMDIEQNKAYFKVNALSYSDVDIDVEFRINAGKWNAIADSDGHIDFSSYAYDDYLVKFRSRKEHSDWAYSDTYRFVLSPPWYKTDWIMILLCLGVSCLLGLLFVARLKVVSRRNRVLKHEISKRFQAESELTEVRENIAKDFHDDLGNKLASISLLSDVLSSKFQSEEQQLIKTIKNDADYLYKGTKDFIFSLQEKSNFLDELRVYLSDFAEDYFHQFGIDFEVRSTGINNLKLPHYWSKQIIFIFKEAITNVVKHSQATNVVLTFEQRDDKLLITLNDNGVGFEHEAAGGNGLLNMKLRAKRISCSLDITSSKNQGTEVTFVGQLPETGS